MEYSSIGATTHAGTSPASVVKTVVEAQGAKAAERLVTPKDAGSIADTAARCDDQKGLCLESHKTEHQVHGKSKEDDADRVER